MPCNSENPNPSHPDQPEPSSQRGPQADEAEDATNDRNARDATPSGIGCQHLPSEVFSVLPTTLRIITKHIRDDTDRDLFLTGVLPVLAGAFGNVRIWYGGEEQSLNLYMGIVAPAGSGKGKFRLAKRVGKPLHEKLLKRSKRRQAEWEKSQLEDNTPTQSLPPLKTFFLPGDSSAAATKEALEINPHSVIFETEISTIGTVLQQDWGSFKDVFLKSAHNESITVRRKSGVPISIPHPALSIALSGTPDSVSQVVHNVDDGLFSRFNFYTFEKPHDFKNQFRRAETTKLEENVENAGGVIQNIYSVLTDRNAPLRFELNNAQQTLVTACGKRLTKQFKKANVAGHMFANLKRAMLTAVRIAGIMAILRHHAKGTPLGEVQAIEPQFEDVKIGLLLATAYLEHAFRLQGTAVRDKSKTTRFSSKREEKFYQQLPVGTFKTKKALQIAKKLDIPERTAMSYLSEFCKEEEMLDRMKRGVYRKQTHEGGGISCISVISGILDDHEAKQESTESSSTEKREKPEREDRAPTPPSGSDNSENRTQTEDGAEVN